MVRNDVVTPSRLFIASRPTFIAESMWMSKNRHFPVNFPRPSELSNNRATAVAILPRTLIYVVLSQSISFLVTAIAQHPTFLAIGYGETRLIPPLPPSTICQHTRLPICICAYSGVENIGQFISIRDVMLVAEEGSRQIH